MHLFDRPRPGGHALEPSLDALRLSADLTRRAVAYNLMHDHRVSAEREQRLTDDGTRLGPPDTERWVLGYFDAKVRTRHHPDYASEHCNAANIMTDTWRTPGVIGKQMQLARILNLNLLLPVYCGAPPSLHLPRDKAGMLQWLDELERGSRDRRRLWIARVFEALRLQRRIAPFQPTWVTSWYRFQREVLDAARPADRWAERLGVPVSDCPQWLIVLRYAVRDVGTVARPTQLDAGFHGYHFPTPPTSPLVFGGHPMDLAVPSTADRLLPEFIHKQIDHTPAHWDASDCLCGKIPGPTSTAIATQRRAHHGLLRKTYPGVVQWMPSCI